MYVGEVLGEDISIQIFQKKVDEGIDNWKATIQGIKDKYPKKTMEADELQKRKDQMLFDVQVAKYVKAKERLSQYILSEGREEVVKETTSTETVWNEVLQEEETKTITNIEIVQTKIDPIERTVEVEELDQTTDEVTTITVVNPAVALDEAERASAQEIVDNTPQAVIDSLS